MEANPDITVGLIPLAIGGTEIEIWSKPSYMYFVSVSNANWARQYGVVKGVLWHQGEHDSYNVFDAYSYEEDLTQLIDNFRLDIQDPYLPFILGGLTESEHEFNQAPLRGVVGGALKNVALNFPNCAYVSPKDVPFVPDNEIHFTSDGQREMGRRYASQYLSVIDYWTDANREWLETGSEVDEESGWKYNPELGIYYDEFWPIIQHAQLGWLKIGIDENQVISLDSPFIGKFRIMKEDDFENAIYIQSVTIADPEEPMYGTPIYVNLTREPGDPYVFYDHSVNAYIDRLPGMTVIQDTWDLNNMVEAEYYQAQLAAQYLRNTIADEGYWSNMRKFVDDVVYHRNYTNYIGWQGYHYSDENETGNLRTFWMDKFFERLYYIDDYVIQAQTDFQSATNVLLNE